MPWAYSVDLRELVVAAYELDPSRTDVAEQFGLGEATVYRWVRRKREQGTVAPLPHRSGNPPRIPPERYELLRKIIAAEPDLNIREIRNEYARRAGGTVPSHAAMCRTLKRAGLSRKKSRS